MSRKKNILVVDDEELNRKILALILEDKYNILEASNGRLAAQTLVKHGGEISLILLDIMMPVEDGFTFLKRLQSREDTRDIPVIFVTSETYEENILEGVRLGVKDVIAKPFQPEVVASRVDNLIQLAEHRAQREQTPEPEPEADKPPPNTILIVDDVGINRIILRGALEDRYEILEADNGQQALEHWKANRDAIAAVLLDIVMPVMDGTETLKRARRSGLLGKIPVLVITGEESQLKRSGMVDLGACEVIPKPFTPAVVRGRVEHMTELAWGLPHNVSDT